MGGQMGIRRLGWVLGSALVAVVVIVAIVVGPSLTPRAAPNEPAQATAVDAPTWSAGDTWNYNVTLRTLGGDLEPAALDGELLAGVLTKSVAGTVPLEDGETAYNVTVSLDLDGSMAGRLGDTDYVRVTSARVDGYSWYRTEDLAKVLEVRSARIEGEVPSLSGSFRVSLTVQLETTYEPAWDAWSFPIEEDETWPVVTNATVHGQTAFRLDQWDGYVEIGRSFSFTIPLNYTMMSATFEDVATPAGTFSAIRTFAVVSPPDLGDDLEFALALAGSESMPHASIEAWFSGDVGNVVRAVSMAGLSKSVRLEVVLIDVTNA